MYQRWKAYKSLRNAMQHRSEAIMEYSAHKPKYGNAGSSSRRCTKTPKNTFEGVRSVSCKVASLLAMQCPSTTTYKWRYLMSKALTSWDHSKSPMTASTSSSPLITYQNGWKLYLAELLTLGMKGRCFMK